MKTRSTRLSFILSVLLSIGTLGALQGQTLGQNYLALSGDYATGGGLDSWGGGIGLNYNLHQTPDYGIDLNGGFGFATDDTSGVTIQQQAIDAGLTAYLETDISLRPFITGLLAYNWSRISVPDFRTRESSWVWAVGAGLEWNFADGWSVTPSILYADFPDYSSDQTSFSIALDWWATESIGLGASYSYVDFSGGNADVWALTLRYRF